MRQREFDYDDILRRALRTAADGIEPAGDGLERIRARLTTPRPLAAWLMAGYTDVTLPALAWLWSFLGNLRVWLRPDAGSSAHARAAAQARAAAAQARATAQARAAAGQARAAYRHLRSRPALGRLAQGQLVLRYGWLRLAAVASAIVIAVAGGYALSQLPGAISNSGAENLPLSSSGSHPHGGKVNSGAATQLPGPYKSTGPGGGILNPTPSASATCSPTSPRRASGSQPKTKPSPTGSPTPTPSVTPTPTPTPTPTDTGTPTPTPTSTGAPATIGASPAMSPAGIVPPSGPANPAASPDPAKRSTPISPAPCRSGR